MACLPKAFGLIGPASAADAQASAPRPTSIAVKDRTEIFYKDWGTKQASDKLEGLFSISVRMGFAVKQQGMRTHDEQFAQVSIAHLRDAPQPLLAAGRVLLGRQPEKSGEFVRTREAGCVLNGSGHRRGGDRAEPENAHQPGRPVHNTFITQPHLVSRRTLRQFRAETAVTWDAATAA